jgi:hypothetical protein
MWTANGKTATLVLFLDSLFSKVWRRLWTCCKTDYYLKSLFGLLDCRVDVLEVRV